MFVYSRSNDSLLPRLAITEKRLCLALFFLALTTLVRQKAELVLQKKKGDGVVFSPIDPTRHEACTQIHPSARGRRVVWTVSHTSEQCARTSPPVAAEVLHTYTRRSFHGDSISGISVSARIQASVASVQIAMYRCSSFNGRRRRTVTQSKVLALQYPLFDRCPFHQRVQ